MEDIRSAVEAAVGYLGEHPDEARYTDSAATATREEGLRFRVEGPNGESIVTDMPAAVGGGGAAPSPGWFFRAGLAACVGSLVAIEAARDGIRLETLRVEVDSESDDRGILGMDESTPAGPLSVRVAVHLTAPASKGDGLRSVAERAATRCPVFDTLGRAIPVALDVHTA